MRLERVEIRNFRAVRRLAIELDAVTAVIGEHDCGKSSLIAAIAIVLDPDGGRTLPQFQETDFHRALDDEDESPARDLSITIEFRRRRPEEAWLRPDVEDDGEEPVLLPDHDRFAIRLEARRTSGAEPETRLVVLDEDGRPLAVDDPAGVFEAARRNCPAIVIRWFNGNGNDAPRIDDGPLRASRERISNVYRRLSQPGAVGESELESVMEDVRQAAGRLVARLMPAPERDRSVHDLADTPQPLITDLRAAMRPDAGVPRQIALLLMIGTLLEAAPAIDLGPQSDPILLFDDIETKLHPIWLAAVSSLATNLPVQKVLATHSSEVLNWMPLRSLRRLVRTEDGVQARFVGSRTLTHDEMRRVTYHLRLSRGGAFFARCWVLVEGETEAWLVPEFARLTGVEFAGEGIRCVEFAQCGVRALVKLARALRIGWILLADGDRAGESYVDSVKSLIDDSDDERAEVLQLDARDVEHYLYEFGFAKVIAKAAGRRSLPRGEMDERRLGRLIRDATKQASKPGLALAILESANERGGKAVPPAMRHLAERARDIARATAGAV